MRRQAAAVPASKAVIGLTYAVMRDDELTRFVVKRVTTHRIANNGSPHDYESEITGYFLLGDQQNRTTEEATIQPHMLRGRFEEYQELVKKQEAEKAKTDQIRKQQADTALELRSLLYRVSGLEMPNDPTEYRQPFKVGKYGSQSDVDLEPSANEALLNGLKKLLSSS